MSKENTGEHASAMVVLSPRSRRGLRKLMRELERVRREGYALDGEESEEGVKYVAAPIRNHRDEVVAAVSISGPASRIDATGLPSLKESVIKAADEISLHLG